LAPTAVTAQTLESAAQAADDAAAEIRRNGMTLINSMQAQTAGFTGQAGTAFRNVLTDLMGDLNTILTQLENMSANTRVSATRLFGQDEASAASLNRIAPPTGVTGGLT
jgi:WXG100 family type VII secretion target